MQLVCFGFFSFVAARFVFISRKFKQSWPSGDWLKLLYAINCACFIILVLSSNPWALLWASIMAITDNFTIGSIHLSYVRLLWWPEWIYQDS